MLVFQFHFSFRLIGIYSSHSLWSSKRVQGLKLRYGLRELTGVPIFTLVGSNAVSFSSFPGNYPFYTQCSAYTSVRPISLGLGSSGSDERGSMLGSF